MRISDWSSDVCSSDLTGPRLGRSSTAQIARLFTAGSAGKLGAQRGCAVLVIGIAPARQGLWPRGSSSGRRLSSDRKSVVSGKSVSVRVDLGGGRLIKIKNTTTQNNGYTYIKQI